MASKYPPEGEKTDPEQQVKPRRIGFVSDSLPRAADKALPADEKATIFTDWASI